VSEFVNVSSQQELDNAVANGDIPICREGFYSLSGNATARLSGNATARLFDNATAQLFDNATARLSGNATARLSGNATAQLFDNATARLFDNATAQLFGNATAQLSGNATAQLFGNATARLFDNATAEGSKYTAIHKLSKGATASGGVIIDVPEITTMGQFLDYYGVDVKRGKAIVYKLVDDNWTTAHGVVYEPGSSPSCGDWNPQRTCGGGLHFSPRPFMARKYSNGSRFVACEIKLADAVVITDGQPDKVKAKGCKVLFECDEDGRTVELEAKAA
jgi:hypothetical protein